MFGQLALHKSKNYVKLVTIIKSLVFLGLIRATTYLWALTKVLPRFGT